MKKGNMYDFTDVTFNPLAGHCEHECVYCSTKSFRWPKLIEKYSGPLRLVESEFKKKWHDKYVFVVAQNDLFAHNVPSEYILRVIEHCRKQPSNTYLFQSKNPWRFVDFLEVFPPQLYPEKTIFATTIESDIDHGYSKGATIEKRAKAMRLLMLQGYKTMITIEPVCDFNVDTLIGIINDAHPDYINLGGDSKHHNLKEPSRDKLIKLIDGLDNIHKKTNLNRLLK